MSIFEYDKKEEYEFGAQNTKKEICRSMKKENISNAMISKILGVNQATIEKWIAEKEVLTDRGNWFTGCISDT